MTAQNRELSLGKDELISVSVNASRAMHEFMPTIEKNNVSHHWYTINKRIYKKATKQLGIIERYENERKQRRMLKIKRNDEEEL